MKDFKNLLTSFIEVVTFLFAAFGGFLKKVAPPDQAGAQYPVGIMSFLMLIVLLAISAIARKTPAKIAFKRWVGGGLTLFILALFASFLYPYALSHYTYPQASVLDQRRISAADEYLTAEARQYKAANPAATAEELEKNFPEGSVWTKTGLERAELRLLIAYAGLVLTLSGSIFCLLEANIRTEPKRIHQTSTTSNVK